MAKQTRAAKKMSTIAAAMAMIILTGTQTAFAQRADSVTVDVGECVGLESAADRLACYEAQVDAVLEERSVAGSGDRAGTTQGRAVDASQNTPAAAAAAQRETRAERRPERRAAEQPREADEAEGTDEYFGTIAALRERLPSSYIITLDNGQVWEQTMPKQYALRPGLAVRIYPSRWGTSYRLAGESTGGFIQVRRVQ